jgi:polyferredoxin
MIVSNSFIEQLPMPGLWADAILVLHAAVVAFVVLGQLVIIVGWLRNWQWVRWFWLRLVHLSTIAFVVVQTWLGQLCPLTFWEQQLRAVAGEVAYEKSFIEFWLSKVLFYDLPWWVFIAAYTVFGLLVLVTWWRLPPIRKRAEH